MRQSLKDREHLLRMLALLVAAIAVFLFVRSIAVPKDYGRFGPFRASALDDIAAMPVVFAGHSACEECHSDVVEARQGSKHTQIHCEICHGPAAAHAADPTASKPARPDGRELCLNCHVINVARPADFPQINPREHGDEGPCTACHPHHHPEP
jgi:mono/diheme cytochrome c family protein